MEGVGSIIFESGVSSQMKWLIPTGDPSAGKNRIVNAPSPLRKAPFAGVHRCIECQSEERVGRKPIHHLFS